MQFEDRTKNELERNSILPLSHHVWVLQQCRLVEIPLSHSVVHIWESFYQLKTYLKFVHSLDLIKFVERENSPDLADWIFGQNLLTLSVKWALGSWAFLCIAAYKVSTNNPICWFWGQKNIVLLVSLNNFTDRTETDSPNGNCEMLQPWKEIF